MANKATTFTIRGVLDYAKMTGKARPHTGLQKYDKGPFWSLDINPDAKSRERLLKEGLEDKFKRDKKTKKDGTPTKNPRDYDYIQLRILENRADGEKNDPPSIIDASGRPWGQDEIGNGSIADVMVRKVDYGDTVGLYFQKMRILKHVPFEGGSTFEPLSEDDEFFSAPEESKSPETGKMDSDIQDDPEDDEDVPF